MYVRSRQGRQGRPPFRLSRGDLGCADAQPHCPRVQDQRPPGWRETPPTRKTASGIARRRRRGGERNGPGRIMSCEATVGSSAVGGSSMSSSNPGSSTGSAPPQLVCMRKSPAVRLDGGGLSFVRCGFSRAVRVSVASAVFRGAVRVSVASARRKSSVHRHRGDPFARVHAVERSTISGNNRVDDVSVA